MIFFKKCVNALWNLFFEDHEILMHNVNRKKNWVLVLVLLQVIGSQMSQTNKVRFSRKMGQRL